MIGTPHVSIAPWYSVVAGGFVARLNLLDEGGSPVGYRDGATVHLSYDEAVEASQALRTTIDEATAA